MKVNNIILIGFMGSGKTTVGKKLAQEMGWQFIDTDRKIEELTGLTITELFKASGEMKFRSEEALMIKKIQNQTQSVIATGGGTVVAQENFEILKQMGVVVYLFAPLDSILKRVKINKDRPLLLQPLPVVEKLWLERREIYRQADVTVDTRDKDAAEIVKEILDLMQGGSSFAAENRY